MARVDGLLGESARQRPVMTAGSDSPPGSPCSTAAIAGDGRRGRGAARRGTARGGAGACCRDRSTHSAPVLGFIAGCCCWSACGGIVAWLFTPLRTAPHALAEQTRVVLAANPRPPGRRRGRARAGRARRARSIGWPSAYHSVQRDLEAQDRRSGRAARRGAQPPRGADVGTVARRPGVQRGGPHPALQRAGARALRALRSRARRCGLGRSVFALLDREQVAHALDKIQYALDAGRRAPSTRFDHRRRGARPAQRAGGAVPVPPAGASAAWCSRSRTSRVSRAGSRSAFSCCRRSPTGMRAPAANMRGGGREHGRVPRDGAGAAAALRRDHRGRVARPVTDASTSAERVRRCAARPAWRSRTCASPTC